MKTKAIEHLKDMGIEVHTLHHRGEAVECVSARGIVALLEAGILPDSGAKLRVYRAALERAQAEAPLLSPSRQRDRAVMELFTAMGVEVDTDYGPN